MGEPPLHEIDLPGLPGPYLPGTRSVDCKASSPTGLANDLARVTAKTRFGYALSCLIDSSVGKPHML